jgi:hypothetical protein
MQRRVRMIIAVMQKGKNRMAKLPKYFYFRLHSLKHGTEIEIEDASHVDVVEVVRCKDCKHRIINEHAGEKGYLNLKAMCELDSGDPFELGRCAEDDEWFCADAERREDETD